MRRQTVKRYAPCTHCRWWSLRVDEKGRLARHSVGLGYAEDPRRLRRTHPSWRAGKVCEGSGQLVDVNLHHQLIGYFTFLALLGLREPPPHPDACPACGKTWPGNAEECPGCGLWSCSACGNRDLCDADCYLAPWNTETDPAVLASMREAEDADH